MNQYILIDHIRVQNANAIAGFTWGFPAITHFLGFIHNLTLKLAKVEKYQDISLTGCAVIAHEHKVHTYRSGYEKRFTQSRNPPYLHGTPADKKSKTAPVIEEGRMNMTVSLLIGCDGNIGSRADELQSWVQTACLVQRLADGTILGLDKRQINFFRPESPRDVSLLTRRLLPGFILQDRSEYLADYHPGLPDESPEAELLDSWLDFSALKYKARPKCERISKHLQVLARKEPDNQMVISLVEAWQSHLDAPYQQGKIPQRVLEYFAEIKSTKADQKLVQQWQEYCQPTEKSSAIWEYIKKPRPGYLVPIMTGYKAISQVYTNREVTGTRDTKTDVCFVESVHSIGEWQSVHRLKTLEQLRESLWSYAPYKKDWYLCKQGVIREKEDTKNSEEELFS